METEQGPAGDDVHGDPEPVHHIRPVRLWNNLAAQVGDGREVHAYGHLQGEEGNEGQDGVHL